MFGQHAVFLQGGEVLRRAVAFVFVETVLRVTFGKRVHFGIARGFSENGGGGDFDDFAVALDDGFGGNAQIFRNAVAVYQYLIRHDRQTLDSAGHRQHGGVQDIEFGNFFGRRGCNAPRNGLLFDQYRQSIALFLAEFFRIGQAGQVVTFGQDDGGGKHAADQRPAPCFVHARKEDGRHIVSVIRFG